MLDPRIKDKVSQAYVRIGEIGYKAAINLSKGKDHTAKQEELWKKGRMLRYFVKLLVRHVDLDTTPPTLYRVSEEWVNRILLLIDKVGKLDMIPVYPTIQQMQKPTIFKGGKNGENGKDGEPGTDANIIVEAAPGETQLAFSSYVDISGVKHFRGSFTTYKAPSLSISTVGGAIFQKGVVLTDKVVNLTTTKGTSPIATLTISDPDLNAILQPLIDLAVLNGVTQPEVTFIIVPNIDSNLTVTAVVADGTNSDSATLNITFYYPWLYGASTTILTTTHYTALTKRLQGAINSSFAFNDTGKYFWIMYPASFGTLSSIKDQNGFEVISAFTTGVVDVSSSGLDADWTLSYRYYRTTAKTDITGTFTTSF